MQKLRLTIALLYTITLIIQAPVLQADPDSGARIHHYGPAREIFVYALDSFVKHRSEQGIEKMTEQILTLRKKDGSIDLDGRTSDHIRYIHKRYRKENDEDTVLFMAPFLFASGTSFINNLGQSRESYEWATKKDKEPSASHIDWCRLQMEDSQWDMNAALKGSLRGKRIITQDIMRIKRKDLKKSFPYLPEDYQIKVLQEAEASFSSDCKLRSNIYADGKSACEDFYEKLIIMREAHKDFKEKEAVEQEVVAVDAAPTKTGPTSGAASTSNESTPQNNAK